MRPSGTTEAGGDAVLGRLVAGAGAGGEAGDAGQGLMQGCAAALPFRPELEEAGLGDAGPVGPEGGDVAGELAQGALDGGRAGVELGGDLLELLGGDPDAGGGHVAPPGRALVSEQFYVRGETAANECPQALVRLSRRSLRPTSGRRSAGAGRRRPGRWSPGGGPDGGGRPGTALDPEPARKRAEQAATVDGDGGAGGVHHLRRERLGVDDRRGRGRHLPRPGHGTAEAPRADPGGASRAVTRDAGRAGGRRGRGWGTRGRGVRRGEGCPVGGVAAAAEAGGVDRFGAEEALDAGEGAGRALFGLGLLAPEAGLAAQVGNDLVGRQRQAGERSGEVAGPPGQPAVELPPDPLGHGRGHPSRRTHGAQAGRSAEGRPGDGVGAGGAGWGGGGVVAPDAGEGLALVGLGFDAEAGAGQAEPVEAGDQLVGQGLGGEGGDVDPVGRGVELGRHAEVGWGAASSLGVLVEAAGQAGGAGALGAEAGGQGGPWQGGQVAEGAQAEADQQVGEVGAAEGGHREGGQEGAAAARGDDGLVAGGQAGGEGAVGDPDPAAAAALDGGVDGGGHRDGQGRLAAVVAGGAAGREGALARLEDLDPGGEPLDRHQHRLEGAGVPGRVVVEQLQLRAAPLGLAPAQAGPDALGPGGRRAGDDAVGVDDSCQAVRRRPGGHHRPVRAPDHQHAGHRGSPHPASASGSSGGPGGRPSPAGASPSPARARPAGPSGPTRGSPVPAGAPAGTTVPSGDGSQRRARRSRVAAPRPATRTSTWRAWRLPWPWPRPLQALEVTARRRSAGSGQAPMGTRTAPRSRAWAAGSRAGERTSTTSTASRRAATTVGHAPTPGAGTRARRSRATPASAAATIPRSGRPTAATQEPAAEAPATRARARAAERLTVTVAPRRRPRPGSSDWRAGTTGSSRSSAKVAPGPPSSTRGEARELLTVALGPLSVAAIGGYIRTYVRECQAPTAT